MATIVVISILAVVCIFMVYVLVEFHLEAKRPRRTVASLPKGVVAFRRSFAEPGTHVTEQRPNDTADSFALHTEKTSGEVIVVALPVRIRRSPSKRAGRRWQCKT